MNYFIKNIHVNKLFHLENIDIPIANAQYPHLLITGKNGSGKTILLNAVADKLNRMKDDISLGFLSLASTVELWKKELVRGVSEKEIAHAKMMLQNAQKAYNNFYAKLDITFDNYDFIEKYSKGDFVIAFYQADRKPKMSEPKNPTKPVYEKKGDAKVTATAQFLNFLSDLKIQEALARNEKQIEDADIINDWFADLEGLLKQIFQDENLKLEFNYKDYSFKICTEGKEFGFNNMSDGYNAIIDIVADLILKMQNDNSLTRVYQKEGIVLIDEIETHLHLALQKVIMPLLTRIFPNIQFIITTHSPFILNSIPNAVAYDLEHQKVLNDLTDYSYEALAEGYFDVSTESSSVEMRLHRLQKLLGNENLSDSDKNEIRQLMVELDKISEAVSPDLVGEYIKVKLDNVDKIREIGK